MRIASRVVAGVAGVVLMAGCGASTPAAQTVTVQQPVAAPPPPPPPVAAAEPRPRPPAAKAELIAVPDVVGKNHQAAQDEMQSIGLYALAERDATGKGRLLLYDRNWHVVAQDPAAGTKVSASRTITLSSKKYTDP